MKLAQELEVLFSAEQIAARVREMGKQIEPSASLVVACESVASLVVKGRRAPIPMMSNDSRYVIVGGVHLPHHGEQLALPES